MSISWSNVAAIAPELSTVGTDTQNAILAQVNGDISDDAWPSDSKADRARAWLAAHLATLVARAGSGGAVQSESVGSVSRSYAISVAAGANELGSTSYGIEYERLCKAVPAFRFDIA